jgi:hypothetical protein
VSLFADLDGLASRFAACRLAREEWTHQAHLAVGMWHVDRYGADDALARLRAGIRQLNDSHGTPNSATRGYHETITRANVQLLSEFLDSCPAALTLTERVARLLASPVADKEALLQFYSRGHLMSAQARAEWVEPDIRPLRVSALVGSQVERRDLLEGGETSFRGSSY